MTYQEERLVKLKRQLSKRAIDLAMEGRWEEAIVANKEILENFPRDADACNRLGRAHLEVGEYAQARDAYHQATEIDPYNAIARKNLQRMDYLKEPVGNTSEGPHKVEPQHFIEDIGKTGIVSLCKMAPKEVSAPIVAGDTLLLSMDGLNVNVLAIGGTYLGQIEPKHGQRLSRFMKGGSRYTAAVISSTEETMNVIIREIYHDPSQAGKLSFPPREGKGISSHVVDRVLKMGADLEDEDTNDSGYTIVGGDEIEVMPEESMDMEEDDMTGQQD